jgi:sugar phosphate permease
VALAMATYGWRATAFASGVLILVLCLPLSFVFRAGPRTTACAWTANRRRRWTWTRSVQKADDGTRDFTAREALRTPAFWLISLGHGFALLVVQAINTHAITHMKEGLGYTLEQARSRSRCRPWRSSAGSAWARWIGDRYNKRILSVFCMLGHAAACSASPTPPARR